MDSNQWKEECALFGIWGDEEASRMAYLSLYAQQHRGQESAGIVSLEGQKHNKHKGFGLVGKVFEEEDLLKLKGTAAIGHNRYSTTGENLRANIQPLSAHLHNSEIALAHNGNIVNAEKIKKEFTGKGALFQGTNDSEVLLHLLAHSKKEDCVEGLKEVLPKLIGAYCFCILTNEKLVVARDPLGFRPLVLGERIHEGKKAYCVASETCAFDLIGAKYIREVEPGEILCIDDSGVSSHRFAPKNEKLSQCVFEHVYFSRPDSQVFGGNVYSSRKEMGKKLAQEDFIEADIVIPVPDSGVAAAIGYSQECGKPFEMAIIRNHYIGRTFIQPSQSIRSFGVKIKLNPQAEVLKGKKVVVIDDSLVRGTTSKKIISLIRAAGAKEVHFRIACPPTKGSCYYGVDTPDKEQLIANTMSVKEIEKTIGADSLVYLSGEGLKQSIRGNNKGFCMACFDGKYPTELFKSL